MLVSIVVVVIGAKFLEEILVRADKNSKNMLQQHNTTCDENQNEINLPKHSRPSYITNPFRNGKRRKPIQCVDMLSVIDEFDFGSESTSNVKDTKYKTSNDIKYHN